MMATRLFHHLRCSPKVSLPSSSFLVSRTVTNKAAGHLDREAVADLFVQYAKQHDGIEYTLDHHDVGELLRGIGEEPNERRLQQLFATADLDGNGLIDLEEFMENADALIGDNPARIILIVGGPGSVSRTGERVRWRRLLSTHPVSYCRGRDCCRSDWWKSAMWFI